MTGEFDATALVNSFAELAIRAGAVILEVRDAGIDVMSKDDASPVTEADRRAEELILAGLEILCPGIPVVAEEASSAGKCPQIMSDRFILVDPLDGTREFIAGRPDFTVNIALIENGVPVAGVVYPPMRKTLYAAAGGRAWKVSIDDDGQQSEPVALACRAYQSPPCIVASKSHLTPETAAFIENFEGATTSSVGSSLKFCMLAEGQADLYPRYGRTMEWDTAAGDAVLRAAGGATRTLDGTTLVYGKRNQANDTDFANPFFISASSEGVEHLEAANNR